MRLGLSIISGAVPAGTTRPAGVARVAEEDGDTSLLRLVRNELPQLIECPSTKHPSELASKTVGSVSDSLEVFEAKCLTRGKSGLDKPLADVVIDPRLETALTPPKAAQVPIRRLAVAFHSLMLKARAKAAHTTTNCLDRFTAILLAFGVRGDLNNTKIDAKSSPVGVGRRGLFDITDSREEPDSCNNAQIGLSLLRGKKMSLMLPAGEGKGDAAIESSDRNLGLRHLPGQDTIIVGNSARGAKDTLYVPVEFVSIGDFGDTPDHQLCGKCELVSDAGVAGFMYIVLLKDLIIPRPLTQCVAGFISPSKRLQKRCGLFGRSNQFHLRDEFHIYTGIGGADLR